MLLSSRIRSSTLSFVFVLVVGTTTTSLQITKAATTFELPSLPYDKSALEPFISEQTLQYHHGKHHAKYVATTNSMIMKEESESGVTMDTLEDIMIYAKKHNKQGLYNNAAQSWNHDFYWKCMSRPLSTTDDISDNIKKASKNLYQLLVTSFDSIEKFQLEFAIAGNTAFGSGWAWLVYDTTTKKLIVMKTIGAENPMNAKEEDDGSKLIPILTMDVWEHAYYLDYQNLRTTYVENFLTKLVNWEFVANNLETAISTTTSDSEL